ncbi:MAG TPA: histidine kinase famiy protein [Noviherbaspirillum sp.]|jgi:PAS domain S-box-containing protein|uniref:histidine kinase famiy protein n=1 Tax=Noviherbaspirillum sp. TaxID=1926288 RepID=UPI002DDD7814|nr:histidine kinase famiy protein [Noviherbaspirillum sp.]HEV2612256.1 histidine kinase famiy protein [Noviherbaspirillum sp.]
MAIGSKGDEGGRKPLEVEGGGDSAGVAANAELEGNSYHPLGGPGIRHWQASYITRPGLGDRSSVFFAAVEMTRMPMVVSDPNLPDNPIVFVNRAFIDLTGYEEQDVLGRNCRFLQGELTDPDTVAEIRAGVSEGRAVAVDILNYKADGTSFWNALFIGPIFDEQGKLLYFFASQIDITRRRISEQAFRQAQKMEAIGQLTAGLAHDFNNLLQVVTGNLEVVEPRLRDDEVALQAIRNAQRAAEKGGKLTQQLLTFARKQRLDPKRINLNTLVVEFSEMLVRTLGEKVDLRLDLKPGLPACTIDPVHMEMALLNVLINARDAMPRGGKVTVATATMHEKDRTDAHHVPAGTYVILCVIDEGEGMAPEVVHRATEPFFTTKEPGTGLGLAMVHGFVQQSHGRLEIESKVGRGTAVRMIFPVAAERAVPLKPEGIPDLIPDPQMRVQTILLVEDSDDVRQVTDAYLRSQGYRVLTAHSGEYALELIDQYGKVDLLFTDIMMPGGMNGLMLVERVRERIPDIPVLLTTGYMDELADKGINTSSFTILTKPYRRTELSDRIRSALNKNMGSSPRTLPNYRHEG